MSNKQSAKRRRRARRKVAPAAGMSLSRPVATKIKPKRTLLGPHLSGAELAAALKGSDASIAWPENAHVWIAEKAEVLAATPPAEWHCGKCGLPWNGTDWWLEACPNLVQFREGWFDVESVAHWLVRRIAFNWANRARAQLRAGARQMIDQPCDPRVKTLFSKIAETIFADIEAGLDGPLGWCATIDGLNKLEAGFEEEWS
jgi:hypothetical protein